MFCSVHHKIKKKKRFMLLIKTMHQVVVCMFDLGDSADNL